MTASVLLVAAAAFADPVAAPPQPEAERYFREGAALFERGAYREAMTEFEAGYAVQPAPLFLYNIAQAARHAGETTKALAFYRRYLEADPTTSRRSEVEGWIRKLDLAARVDVAVVLARPALTAPPPRARWYKDALGGALLGIGLGGVAVGGTLLGVALGAEHEAARSYGDYYAYLHGSGPAERVAGIVLLGAGAAALVAAVVRYGVVARREHRAGAERAHAGATP